MTYFIRNLYGFFICCFDRSGCLSDVGGGNCDGDGGDEKKSDGNYDDDEKNCDGSGDEIVT